MKQPASVTRKRRSSTLTTYLLLSLGIRLWAGADIARREAGGSRDRRRRVAAYRHRCLYQARNYRFVRQAYEHAFLRNGRADMGAGSRRNAPDTAAGGGAQSRAMADRGWQLAARQD